MNLECRRKLAALHGRAVRETRGERIEADCGAQIAVGDRPFLRLAGRSEQDKEAGR
jgi:hypothetical protein